MAAPRVLRSLPAALGITMLGAASTLAAAAPAAPAGAAGAPQTPGLSGGPPVWLGFAVMFLLTAVVVAISLMPSKRSHQD
jgi:hypothetical protein